jgi:5-methyltetrahydropteroyltriglutamate--homocysteine methyltransferase
MADLARVRTDVVGSLLRPEYLKEAHRRHARGELGADGLRAAEDRAVREAVALQESVGLDVLTDGEMRRLSFQDSFADSVGGFAVGRADITWHESRPIEGQPLGRFVFSGSEEAGPAIVQRRPVSERLRLVRNKPLDEYQAVSRIARTPAKVTLIGPERIPQRWDREGSAPVYADVDAFMADVVRIERRIVRELVDAGCPYVQIDEPGYLAYVDEASRAQMRAQGMDPDESLTRAIHADNAIIAGFLAVTFGIHCCRGNFRGMYAYEGTYDAIAERLFNELAHHRFLLEYDTPRAGPFAPLRFVPRGKVVVLGLVSTKVPETPTVDELCRRIDEAARYLPLEQLAISPQCGFASSVVGNAVGEDDQRRKLARVVETARRMWS